MLVLLNGQLIEVPRHLHKAGGVGLGGESCVVSTEDELHAALDAGWGIDANASLPVALPEPSEPPQEAPALEPDTEPAEEHEESQDTPEPATASLPDTPPAKRGWPKGKPRKVVP